MPSKVERCIDVTQTHKYRAPCRHPCHYSDKIGHGLQLCQPLFHHVILALEKCFEILLQYDILFVVMCLDALKTMSVFYSSNEQQLINYLHWNIINFWLDSIPRHMKNFYRQTCFVDAQNMQYFR